MKEKRLVCLCLLAIAFAAVSAWAEPSGTTGQNPQFKDEEERASYAVGVNVAGSLEGVGVDLDTFLKALSDVMTSKPLTMTQEEMTNTMQAFGAQMQAKQMGQEGGKTAPEVDIKKLSYSIGAQFASNLKPLDMKTDALARGISDALTSQPLALSDEEMKGALDTFKKRIEAKQAAARDEAAGKNLAEATDFLAKNKDKEGVKVTKSGLQYKVLSEGDGPSPKFGDTILTHYKGTFIDGEEFDSSYKRNQPFETVLQPQGLIQGWIEALQMMKKGDKWELYIPPDLAYGAQGNPGMPPNKMLIFQIELVDVKPAGSPPAEGK